MIKQIRKSNCRSLRAVKRVDREIRILKFLRHPGIIPLLDTWQSREHVLMVFKEYKVDLFGFMDPYKNGVCEEYVIQILRSAADAVQYMHQQGVYHLDIKPENLVSEPSPVAVVKHMLWPYAPPHSPTAPLSPAHRAIISACARHSTVPLHFDTRFNE